MKNYGWLWWAFIIPAMVLGRALPAFGHFFVAPLMIIILVPWMGVVAWVIINYLRKLREDAKYGPVDPYEKLEEFRPRGNGLGMGD